VAVRPVGHLLRIAHSPSRFCHGSA